MDLGFTEEQEMLRTASRDFMEKECPTSLVLEKGTRRDPDLVADGLLEAIGTRYEQLESGQEGQLESEYLEHLYLLDLPGRFESGGEWFSGIIRGVNQYGELLVEKEGKILSYGFQQIRYTGARTEEDNA